MIKIIYLCSCKCGTCSYLHREAQTKGWCCFLTKRCDEKSRILVFWRKRILDGPKNACWLWFHISLLILPHGIKIPLAFLKVHILYFLFAECRSWPIIGLWNQFNGCDQYSFFLMKRFFFLQNASHGCVLFHETFVAVLYVCVCCDL